MAPILRYTILDYSVTYFVKIHFSIILLSQGVASGVCAVYFQTKFLYEFLIACIFRLVFFYWESYEFWDSSLCSFLESAMSVIACIGLGVYFALVTVLCFYSLYVVLYLHLFMLAKYLFCPRFRSNFHFIAAVFWISNMKIYFISCQDKKIRMHSLAIQISRERK
jgi:hypothetical protein